MTTAERPIDIRATAWTVGVHILLFLLLMWISYSVPTSAPVEELGMEVNLGTSDNGSGTDQPMAVDAPSEANLAASSKAAAQEQSDARELMQSDDPDAPAVAPVTTTKPTVRHNTVANTESRSRNTQRDATDNNTRPQQPRYVYQGSTGPGGNNAVTNRPGTSEGNTTGNGDRGVPGGTPGAANYTGSPGNGTGGISHSLSGRDISPRQFSAEFNEGGKVVIRVTVDRDGNIVDKKVKSSPSKTLSNIALQKLSQAKFSPNKDAAPQQFGEITIVFKARS
jgi:TonB family protein